MRALAADKSSATQEGKRKLDKKSHRGAKLGK
jgi:hypothetical protein